MGQGTGTGAGTGAGSGSGVGTGRGAGTGLGIPHATASGGVGPESVVWLNQLLMGMWHTDPRQQRHRADGSDGNEENDGDDGDGGSDGATTRHHLCSGDIFTKEGGLGPYLSAMMLQSVEKQLSTSLASSDKVSRENCASFHRTLRPTARLLD